MRLVNRCLNSALLTFFRVVVFPIVLLYDWGSDDSIDRRPAVWKLLDPRVSHREAFGIGGGGHEI